MNSIRVNILGRSYPLKVLDGEEQLMEQIAEFVDARFRLFKTELSTHPEQTIMVLASLSIAEELFAQQRKTNDINPQSISEDQAEAIKSKIRQLIDEIDG
ncbi:MAG TPA: cell division protein ZapA [Bacteroidetes bacterium]|nr:cell division protein ZapA [Bacteroidota bacterium]